MNTQLISASNPQAIPLALDILRTGGLVAFPTDTVYGVGSLAFDQAAIESIYAAKDRPVEKAISILISGVDDLDQLAVDVPELAQRLAKKFWPGPLTLVIPKKPGLPPAISANDTIGVRVPDHAVTLSLLRAAGPLAVSSANLSGRDSPRDAAEVMKQLGGRIPLVVDGGEAPGGTSSTVVDVTGGRLVILREGPLTLEQLKTA